MQQTVIVLVIGNVLSVTYSLIGLSIGKGGADLRRSTTLVRKNTLDKK